MADKTSNKYDDDPVWDASFARSQDVLTELAAEALAEYKAGGTITVTISDREYTLLVGRDHTCPYCHKPLAECAGHTRVDLQSSRVRETEAAHEAAPPHFGPPIGKRCSHGQEGWCVECAWGQL